MSRLALTDGSGKWFDDEKAKNWDEGTWWNGNNHISKVTGSQWVHERLYLTAGGVWVLDSWSQWQGSTETYEEITAEEAAKWFARNEITEYPEELEQHVSGLEV